MHTLVVELPDTDAQWFKNFLTGYVDAMLWSSNDESTPEGGEPFDRNYDIGDLAPEAYARAFADCLSFWLDHRPWITDDNYAHNVGGTYGFSIDAQAGHDFWLTRCGHGAGFWDGDWIGYAGERLDAAAKAFGNQDPYLGDDGLIYLT